MLIADEEQIIADTLATILKVDGYEALAVYSGEQVVEIAPGFQPNLFISDVVMPGITGIEAAARVRQSLPICKILLFSGHAATANLLDQARAYHCDFQLLTRPVHSADLLTPKGVQNYGSVTISSSLLRPNRERKMQDEGAEIPTVSHSDHFE